MKRIFPVLIVTLFVHSFSIQLYCQPFQVSFQPTNKDFIIDSVVAVNTTTNDALSISGVDTITLTSQLSDVPVFSSFTGLNSVYPNPYKNSTNLRISIEKSELVSIRLYSITGQLLIQDQEYLNSGVHTFSVSSRKAGIHILQIKSNTCDESIKLMSTNSNSSGNQITKIGFLSSAETKSSVQLKSIQLSKELRYQAGDMLHYKVFSGGHSTIITDSPIQDKVYLVDFYTCTDGDGKSYPVVIIGDQVWMANNLAYLPQVDSAIHFSYTEPYYYVYGYNGKNTEEAKANSNYEIFGVLYNWPAAKTACPNGWHLPTNDEWDKLAQKVSTDNGGYTKGDWYWDNVGTHLKANANWYTNGTDDYGFSGLPTGRRYWNGTFDRQYIEGYWWSDTEANSTVSWHWTLENGNRFLWSNINKEVGFCVRCIKD